jgi:hypothetical protein
VPVPEATEEVQLKALMFERLRAASGWKSQKLID